MSFIKRIAIISKNKTLSRLCELEVLSCGAYAKVYSSFSADLSEYSVIFCDVDTISVPADIGTARIVAISVSTSKIDLPEQYLGVIEYPFLINDVRRFILTAGEMPYHTSSEEQDTSVVLLDDSRKSAELFGERIPLSNYEYIILKRLIESSGKAVSRTELSALLGAESGNIADVYICHLRKKLEGLSGRRIIYTVRGKGYVIYNSIN